MLQKIKQSKLCSRKFILALLGNIIGVVSLIANEGDGDVQIIASIILIVISTCTYIVQEAKVDAASVQTNVSGSIDQIKELIDQLKNNDDPLISNGVETKPVTETTKE